MAPEVAAAVERLWQASRPTPRPAARPGPLPLSQAAPNVVRRGILATGGGLAAVDKEEDGPPFTYFAHHPLLVPFVGAAAFLVLSVRDWTARAFPAACRLPPAAATPLARYQCVLGELWNAQKLLACARERR